MLIDTHAHVQFSGYKNESDAVMQRALGSGIGVINVGTQIDTSREAVSMLEIYQQNVWAVIGLHPEHTYQHLVDEEESHFRSREEQFDPEAYKQLAQNPRVVGIGECGLDYFRLSGQPDIVGIKQKQQIVFKQQIDLALETDKALVVHCRPSPEAVDAYEDVLEILTPFVSSQKPRSDSEELSGIQKIDSGSPSMTRGVRNDKPLRFEIHCFTGTLEIAKKFVNLGGYLGLNGIITFDKTGNSEVVVKNIPLENIILETDCPYLAPLPFRGKQNEPAYVKYVAEKIAEWKNISIDEVENQTTSNAEKLFKLNL
jgi:TatD DNase family protein